MSDDSWGESTDDLDDYEYPDSDPQDEDSSDTIVCPECGADVYEDAEQCPVCGEYLIMDTRPWSGKPIWWIALGILGIIATVAALASVF